MLFPQPPAPVWQSLLCSTLQAYFEGRKELFEGLAIAELETEWRVHPVFHFDFSVTKYLTTERLDWAMNDQLTKLEKLYGRNPADTSPDSRLSGLVERAREQTGEKVVVIVDEYDAPLHDAIDQGRTKRYMDAFAHDGRPVHLIGVNINTTEGTIDEWRELKIEN